ncbi:MarR family winged helix-turn-helix transcriptional regulator [Nocardioides pacificus]
MTPAKTTVDTLADEARRTQELLALEAQMAFLGRRLRRKLTQQAQDISPGLGINSYAVLEVLAQRGGRRQGEVGEMVGLEKGGLSRAVNDLIELGLVSRQTDPDDGRAHLIDLTGDGRARMNELHHVRRDRFRSRMDEWSLQDLQDLSSLLTRYNATWGV